MWSDAVRCGPVRSGAVFSKTKFHQKLDYFFNLKVLIFLMIFLDFLGNLLKNCCFHFLITSKVAIIPRRGRLPVRSIAVPNLSRSPVFSQVSGLVTG